MAWRNTYTPGEKKNMLTFIEEVEVPKGERRRGRFLCDCGKVTERVFQSWDNGNAQSCGCLRDAKSAERLKSLRVVGQGTPLQHRASDGRPGYVVAEENGIKRATYYARVQKGWDVDRAATLPATRAFYPGRWVA